MASRAGIRELRQYLSRYVDRVKQGETIDVTERGRLVARLVPSADAAGEIGELEARGLVVRAPSLDFASLSRPRPCRRGERAPSEILAEERSSQRY